MAQVEITYKGTPIAELDGTGAKTLKTSGCYCEDDISVEYAPRSRTYYLTLAHSAYLVLLTTLDADVLEHINDSSLIVTLRLIDDYSYTFYSGALYTAGNNIIGDSGGKPVYGIANRQVAETNLQHTAIFVPANNTNQSKLTGLGNFVLDGDKYYVYPSDGSVRAGNWVLTFTW